VEGSYLGGGAQSWAEGALDLVGGARTWAEDSEPGRGAAPNGGMQPERSRATPNGEWNAEWLACRTARHRVTFGATGRSAGVAGDGAVGEVNGEIGEGDVGRVRSHGDQAGAGQAGTGVDLQDPADAVGVQDGIRP
jgi:hypothetical protein